MDDPNETGRLEIWDYNRDHAIEEAANLARGYKSVLAGKAGLETGGDLAERLRKLKQEKAKFTSLPEVIRLDQRSLVERGFALDHRIQQLLQTSVFYVVTFAMTLRPASDWKFDRLDCQIEFNKDSTPQDRPVTFDIFPDNQWDDLLRTQMHLDVGVDESLRFICQAFDLPPELAVHAEGRVKASANFVVPPRSYVLRRAKIQRWGVGDSEVSWRLFDAEFLADEPRLAVVLRVPHELRLVRAHGILAAYHTANIWSADLRKLVADFPSRIRSVFEGGLPIYDQGDWTLIDG